MVHRYVKFSVSHLRLPPTYRRCVCLVVYSGCTSIQLGLSDSSGRVRTNLTEDSGPPQVALRGAALTCFPNETSEAALRDPANKHFAQRFVISVTEEVLPLRSLRLF